MRLELGQGQVWIEVDDLPEGETFEVETPGAVASVRGTRFSARTTPDGNTIVSTREGTVTVSSSTSPLTVTVLAGQQTTVTPSGPESPVPTTAQESCG